MSSFFVCVCVCVVSRKMSVNITLHLYSSVHYLTPSVGRSIDMHLWLEVIIYGDRPKRVIIMCNLAENYILTGVPRRGQESADYTEQAKCLRDGRGMWGYCKRTPKAWRGKGWGLGWAMRRFIGGGGFFSNVVWKLRNPSSAPGCICMIRWGGTGGDHSKEIIRNKEGENGDSVKD